MFAPSSGRSGDFEELGLAEDEPEVAAIAAAGRIPLEVVLPDGSSGERWVCTLYCRYNALTCIEAAWRHGAALC